MGGVASYLTPSVRVLCSLLVPFLRCVQLPMLSILQREQERETRCEQMEQFLRCVQLPMLSILQREQERETRCEQMEQDRGRSLRRNKQ